jgi:predicted HAD superfamily Cof-like phosphohydrolase
MIRLPEDMVREFHDTFDLPRADAPTVPSLEQRRHRLELMVEEFGELAGAMLSDCDTAIDAWDIIADLATRFHAHANRALLDDLDSIDLAAVLDALADIQYTNAGTAVVCGLPLSEAFQAVHDANMAKLWERSDGTKSPRVNESGKVMKPPGWTPPDIAAVLAAATTSERAA